jgi:hypothetical protein
MLFTSFYVTANSSQLRTADSNNTLIEYGKWSNIFLIYILNLESPKAGKLKYLYSFPSTLSVF